jgi:hypothetical protein
MMIILVINVIKALDNSYRPFDLFVTQVVTTRFRALVITFVVTPT